MLQPRNYTLVPLSVRQSSLYTWLSRLYWLLVVYPLEEFFIRGVWHNRPMPDICASLTGHRADYWQQNVEACEEIVARDFDSHVSYVEITLYVLFIVTAVCKCMNRLCRS